MDKLVLKFIWRAGSWSTQGIAGKKNKVQNQNDSESDMEVHSEECGRSSKTQGLPYDAAIPVLHIYLKEMKQTFEEIPSPRVYGNSLGAISSWVDEKNVENIHNAVLFCHKELNHIIYSEINEIEGHEASGMSQTWK